LLTSFSLVARFTCFYSVQAEQYTPFRGTTNSHPETRVTQHSSVAGCCGESLWLDRVERQIRSAKKLQIHFAVLGVSRFMKQAVKNVFLRCMHSACKPSQRGENILCGIGGKCHILDAEFDAGRVQGLLYDVPLTCDIKDIIDGMSKRQQ
jgi:hypothetical protein